MKITATRIKEIIREEYRRMNEADGPRVVELDITPKELEGKLQSGSGDVPRGEFGKAFAKLLGLELADISEVYLIDSSEFQGLVITKSGEKIHLRLGDQPKIRRDDEDALVDKRRRDRRFARQFQAIKKEPDVEPDVRESIEESRETLKQFGKMAKGPKGKITARQAKEEKLGNTLDDQTAAAAVRADLGMKEEAEDAAADPAGRGSEDPGLQNLKADAIEAIRGMTSAQGREDEIIQLFTNIVNIISGKKVDTPPVMTHLGRAKDAIKDTAK